MQKMFRKGVRVQAVTNSEYWNKGDKGKILKAYNKSDSYFVQFDEPHKRDDGAWFAERGDLKILGSRHHRRKG